MPRPPCRAEVRLLDGSLLKGVLRQQSLPAFSPSVGRIRIDLRSVKSIHFEAAPKPEPRDSEAGIRVSPRDSGFGFRETRPSGGRAAPRAPVQGRVSFRNGDRLTAAIPADRAFVVLDTLVGPLRVPFDKVTSVSIEPPNHPTPQPPNLRYHCTFDSASSIEHPAAGPAGAFLGGEFVPGKKGRALLVKARTPAAEVPFPTGLMQPEGCIEFWARIPGATKETRYPDGGNPMFFAMGVGKWVNTFVKYTANDGFGTGGLHADLPGSAYVSSLPSWGGRAAYPDFLGDPSAWHHYALVWSEKGLDAASEALGRRVVSALYVDGRLVNPAYGTNGPDRARFLREFVVNPVVLGFPFLRERQDPNQSQVDYLIDEFKIWSVPKTDFGIDARPVRHYRPELLYHCTFDSAEAVEKSAAGPNGKFLGGEFVPGKVGNALRSPGDSPVAEVDLSKGLLQPRGTIEFWAKIEEPPAFYSDRGNPLFFGLWLFDNLDDPGLCSTHLGWCANNGMGMAGLCGMVYHRAMATDPTMRTNTYGPLLSDPAAWHHYAIVWDSEGLPSARASDGTPAVATLVLDGRVLQTFGRNQQSKGEGLLKLPSFQGKLAFPVPAARWGNPGNHVPFLIDEFKIWSAPKTDFAIPPAAAEPPRLLYHCTFDDAAAIERPAAGPSGKYLGGDFVPGKQGTALRVYADAPAAQTAFKPGDLGRRGMFEFWAKMEEATMETVFGDGGNPRFFCLWADLDKPGANPRSTYLQWSGNDGSGRSGLCAMVSGCTATSEDGWGMRRYPAFLGNPSDWHHYAVVWDENGVFGSSSVVAVYVDGKLVSTGGRNELGLGRKFKSFLDGPVLLGFPQRENEREPAARHVPFLIDEFKIWSAPVVQTE